MAKKKTKTIKKVVTSTGDLTPRLYRFPLPLVKWINEKANYLGLSSNEFLTIALTSLSTKYTDKEVIGILIGTKPTLSIRNAVRVERRESPKQNFIPKGLSVRLE